MTCRKLVPNTIMCRKNGEIAVNSRVAAHANFIPVWHETTTQSPALQILNAVWQHETELRKNICFLIRKHLSLQKDLNEPTNISS